MKWHYIPFKSLPFPNLTLLRLYLQNLQVFANLELALLVPSLTHIGCTRHGYISGHLLSPTEAKLQASTFAWTKKQCIWGLMLQWWERGKHNMPSCRFMASVHKILNGVYEAGKDTWQVPLPQWPCSSQTFPPHPGCLTWHFLVPQGEFWSARGVEDLQAKGYEDFKTLNSFSLPWRSVKEPADQGAPAYLSFYLQMSSTWKSNNSEDQRGGEVSMQNKTVMAMTLINSLASPLLPFSCCYGDARGGVGECGYSSIIQRIM